MVEQKIKYRYLAYGLLITSEIEFKELFLDESSSDLFDLYIKIGFTPKKNDIIGIQKPISAYNENEYWQEIPNIARYYAKNGKEVVIEPLSENWNDIRLFFILNIFNVILFQRNRLPLLASAIINKKNEIVLIAGTKLTGKTASIMQLNKLGFEIFSDDIFDMEFEPSQKQYFGLIGTKLVLFWQNTLNKISPYEKFETYSVRANISKKGFLLKNNFKNRRLPIKSIIILEESREYNELFLECLSKEKALLELHNLYKRPIWVENMNKLSQNFLSLASIANNISIYKLKRPYGKNSLLDLAILLENKIL